MGPSLFARARGGGGGGSGGRQQQQRRRRLTIREALELSPWDKWIYYGIVPYKMICHLLLVFFITLQVCFVTFVLKATSHTHACTTV